MPYDLDTKVTTWKTDYRERHQSNYETIKAALNRLESMLGVGTPTLMDVPVGLREIFDRRGIIGRDSYSFTEGVKPNQILTVNPGAYWTGTEFRKKAGTTNLNLSGRSTGTYYVAVGSGGTVYLDTSTNEDTIWQFDWNSTTKEVSKRQIIGAVSILFDGDDYHDCLTSTARGESFTSLADRLEKIETLIDVFGGNFAQMEHSGLNFHYQAGLVRNDNAVTPVAAGSVTLEDNDTNYVEVDPTTGTVSANTSGFTSGYVPLYQVVTSGGSIISVSDKRTCAIVGTGGGGGASSHTQNTDTGTTSKTFTLDLDAGGTPIDRVQIVFEAGDNPNAILAFNRATRDLEVSYDGGLTWTTLPTVASLLNTQEMTRTVVLDSAVSVYEGNNLGSTPDWEEIDLSGAISTSYRVSAVLLSVVFSDANPSASTYVTFRRHGYESEPTGLTIWANPLNPELLLVPVGDDLTLDYQISASGSSSASLLVAVSGYCERVVGVGTSPREKEISMTVPAGGTVSQAYTGWLRRGLVHYLRTIQTGAATGAYDLEVYADSGYNTLLYKAQGINPASAFEDWLPWWASSTTGSLYLRIVNKDPANGGSYTILFLAEQFA